MTEHIDFAGYKIEIRRRPYQNRLGLAVYPNGVIRISANKTLSQKHIIKFLEEKRSWIEASLKEVEEFRKNYPPKRFVEGEVYPFLGRDYTLKFSPELGAPLQFDGHLLRVRVPMENLEHHHRQRHFETLKKSYKQTAKKLMLQRVDIYSQKMDLAPTGIQFRCQRSIWGSCSAKNKISLNWKLIIAPLEIIDYVIVHEIAHIKHKNHSRRFWDLVEKYVDNLEAHKAWLKTHHYKGDFLSPQSELWPDIPTSL
ncbi:MAG: M48 family metallopeptidase [Bdellovibrionales bacterium]|nr:M48 family metallopeptidase [Bdellovibrionales bacterium]